MSNDKLAATFGPGSRCRAHAASPYSGQDEVLCDLFAGHPGDHLDKERAIYWHHQIPVPS